MLEFKMSKEGFQAQLNYGELPISGYEMVGYSPYELMISSIVGCSGELLRTILVKQRMKIENIHIKAEAVRSIELANRIMEIKLHYTLKGKSLNKSKIHRAIQLASKHCPMIQSVMNSIKIVESFEVVQ